MKRDKKFKKGTSLIELLLTLAIVSIVIMVAYSMFFAGSKSFDTSQNKTFAQQDGRFITDQIQKELRYASAISNDVLDVDKYYYLSSYMNNKEINLSKAIMGNDVGTNKPFLKSIHWKSIEIVLRGEGRSLVGDIIFKTDKGEEISQPITIALENLSFGSGNTFELTSENGEELNRIYYSLIEDTFVSGGNNKTDSRCNPDNCDPWVSGTQYLPGNIVTHKGRCFEAKNYGAREKEPGIEGSWTEWFEVSDYWVSSNHYPQGYIVKYNSTKYRAIGVNVDPETVPGQAGNEWAWEEIFD